jgi:hypothetical protein
MKFETLLFLSTWIASLDHVFFKEGESFTEPVTGRRIQLQFSWDRKCERYVSEIDCLAVAHFAAGDPAESER